MKRTHILLGLGVLALVSLGLYARYNSTDAPTEGVATSTVMSFASTTEALTQASAVIQKQNFVLQTLATEACKRIEKAPYDITVPLGATNVVLKCDGKGVITSAGEEPAPQK